MLCQACILLHRPSGVLWKTSGNDSNHCRSGRPNFSTDLLCQACLLLLGKRTMLWEARWNERSNQRHRQFNRQTDLLCKASVLLQRRCGLLRKRIGKCNGSKIG